MNTHECVLYDSFLDTVKLNVITAFCLQRIELWKEYLQTQTAHPVNSLSCYSTFEDLRLKGLSVMPWVRKVFETLHDNGILYAILTNGHPSIQKGKVTASGIFDWDCGKNITVFYGYESETSVPKPNPKIFHSACGHFNIAYESAVMVGDTLETDIAGARNANLGYAIHLKCGKTSHDCTRVDGLSTKVLEAYSHDHVLELVHALLQQNLHAL